MDRRRKVLVGVVAAVMAAQVICSAPYIDFAVDARVYHETARRLARAEPLYVEAPRRNPYDVTSTFLYPPIVAALLRPAAGLGARPFLVVWYAILGVAAVGLSLALASLLFGIRSVRTVGASMAIVALTPGMEASIAIGNADLVVWALAALALARPGPTPLLVAAGLKVYPAPAWAVLSWRTRRRPSALTLAVMAALVGYTFLTTDTREWLREGIPAMTSGNFTFYNWSLSTFPLRYLAPGDRLLAPGFRVYLTVTSVAAPILVAVLARRVGVRLHAALVLLAGTAFAPLCWWYRLPIGLLLVYASAVADARGGRPADENAIP